MPYFHVQDMTDEQKELFLEWLLDEGLNASEIRDNGRFSVHEGRVSGEKFLFADDGETLIVRKYSPVTTPFNVPQKHPLPVEVL